METTVNRLNIFKFLLTDELRMVGKTLTELVEDNNWRFNNTLTRNEFVAFRSDAIKLIQKTFKCNRTKSLNTFKWYWDNFGLRIKG